jgi:hypothetical protein
MEQGAVYHAVAKEKYSDKMVRTNQHIARISSINGNIASKLTRDEIANFKVAKLEIIFKKWSHLVVDRKLAASRLKDLISKHYHQVAFDQVRDFNWQMYTQTRIKETLRKLTRLLTAHQLKGGYHRWKTNDFIRTQQIIEVSRKHIEVT